MVNLAEFFTWSLFFCASIWFLVTATMVVGKWRSKNKMLKIMDDEWL